MISLLKVAFFEWLEDIRGIPIPVLIMVLVIWVAIFVWQAQLVDKGKIFNGGLRRIEAAIKEGRVIEAHFASYKISTRRPPEGGGLRNTYYFTYEYEVNGIQYKKTISADNSQHSDIITLYYDRSAKRAKTYGEMRGFLQDFWPFVCATVVSGAVLYVFFLLSIG